MLWTHAAAAILAGALAFAGAWKTQDWRYTGQIAKLEAAHAEALAKSATDALAKVQALNANNAKVTNAYLAQKAIASAAAGRAVAAGRMLSEALAGAASTDRNTPANSGPDDPRGAIAGECASALRTLDGYAGELANKARALQDYASSVCVSR